MPAQVVGDLLHKPPDIKKRKEEKRKSMLLGVIAGVSVPRGSPGVPPDITTMPAFNLLCKTVAHCIGLTSITATV